MAQYGGCKACLSNKCSNTLFQQSRKIINMDTNKGSDVFKYLRDKYGEDSVKILVIGNLQSRKWQIRGTIDALHLNVSS